MTNAEWVIENRPDLFSGFDCPECSKIDENGHCTRPEDADFDKRECAKGHVAWLMQPRESASEGEGGPVSVPDECEPAKEEIGPENDADSRENIEKDIEDFRWFHDEDKLGHINLLDVARCWLDRQAAITRREVIEAKYADEIRELIGGGE